MGTFKRPGINHLLPAINVVGNSALARQKDPTDMAPLKTMWSFCCGKAISLSKFMTGNKWLISVRVNAPIVCNTDGQFTASHSLHKQLYAGGFKTLAEVIILHMIHDSHCWEIRHGEMTFTL